MDKTGGVAIGYNVSNQTTIKPSVWCAFRSPSDPLGTSVPRRRSSTVRACRRAPSRWGDYNTMSVEPVDDCTMVFTTEYLPSNGSFNWRRRSSLSS